MGQFIKTLNGWYDLAAKKPLTEAECADALKAEKKADKEKPKE